MSKKLNVVFICGPRGGGKSTLIRVIAPRLCPQPPHYLRLIPVDGDDPRLSILSAEDQAGLASWRRIDYDAAHSFEFLPSCLDEIAEIGGSRTVLIEADADPSLRYAFPYDHRIFVMPPPCTMAEVFRSTLEAAQALREVMDDTAAFASEIFGLFDPNADEEDGGHVQRIRERGAVTEERLEITPLQMGRFICSPLGAEVASRIQLQPPYHSLMESDVAIVNKALGGRGAIVGPCLRQIQLLISRVSNGRSLRPILFHCELLDFTDPGQTRLLDQLLSLLSE